MAVAAGGVFSTLTGTSLASTAMLGSALVPEMKRKGYSNEMSIGPILGSGQLALMIPPSALAVLLGAIAGVSIGKLLIAIILPGILMAVLFCAYIIVRCIVKPGLAPPYPVANFTFKEKIVPTLRYVIPVFFIIFCVVGVIYFGIATPTEASATGAMACLIFVAYLKRATKEVLVKSLTGTVRLSVMILLIVATSSLFSQILSFSGAARGLTNLAADMQVNRYFIFVGMMGITFILGMFLSAQPIIMICIPVFMPIVTALGFNEIWFCVLFLLNLEIGTITPPFGLALFVMKGATGRETSMRDVIIASVPFILLDFVAMAIFTAFPSTCLWLVETMG
jgi:tripartite ATP-independent transporter DctM subunit